MLLAAMSSSAAPAPQTIPALMISDIHFDPFHDPAKLQQLVDAPASQWNALLTAPPSPDQQQAFDALQKQCQMRGEDTPYALFQSSLQAMHEHQSDAKFITISGDLLAHTFDCRYQALLPKSTPAEYQAFVLKTLSFIMAELRATFPGIPIYTALGNNDSGCGDYKLTPNSDFLAQTGEILAEALPSSEQQAAAKQFAVGGYFSVTMPEPMQSTRIIVVNDLMLSPKYTTCGGMPDVTAANAEMNWLKQQLAEAKQSGQKAWVMAHIPPGIDPYSTAAKMKNVCTGAAPVVFLSSGKLADLMIEYASTIRLGIFAHSHMDEFRLLEPDAGDPSPSAEHSVAVKVVPSISPVDGNNPSFTVAQVDPSTAALADYEVIAGSNQTGISTTWSSEYDFAKTYNQSHYSPAALKTLIAQFHADRESKKEMSISYIRNFFVGDRSTALKLFWPQYTCALDNVSTKSYAACICSAAK
jgi:sphingomyelin phosphodiesterase acid-like 3